MYSQNHAAMAPPQKPETFMLSNEAQQSLPQDAQVALDQVDKRKSIPNSFQAVTHLLRCRREDDRSLWHEATRLTC